MQRNICTDSPCAEPIRQSYSEKMSNNLYNAIIIISDQKSS